ncbi:hypothetical protein T472_0217625 [Youngiibacter fragilis 232.1]|uniref:Phospholipase C/D domain-containing protein n=2 Tax=Youngiibacter TaxID=1408818 RepID=V7I0C3_9CLOT|nr:hypothetical protein T472_0217625 [Youngiibacter fragilis 232.1]
MFMNRMKHTFDGGIRLVEAVCSSLTSERIDIDDFSRNLGIITHFECDFFCRYHLDDDRHDDYLPHFIYEARLHLEYLSSGDFLRFKEEVHVADVRSLVIELRKMYEKGASSFENDLLFAIGAAVSTCGIVVRQQALSGSGFHRESFSAVMTR